MVHTAISYFVDRAFDNIYYGKGLYHRLHLASTDPRWRPVMYLRDDKLKEYTKEKVKTIYDKFIKDQKLPLGSSHNPGEILFRDEGAFLRCFDNSKMIGFLHIPDTVMNDLKERLTVDYITKVAQEVFEQDADFGLYYCGSLCPPEANFADYYYNWNGLEIRIKKVEESVEDQSLEEKNKKLQKSLSKTEKALREKEMTLQEYQKSLQHMAKDNQCLQEKVKMLEKEQSRLLKEMNQMLVEKNRTLEEEVKTLKEQQLKKTAEETTV